MWKHLILLQSKMTLQSPWNTVSSVFGVTAALILTAEYSNLPLRHQKGQTSTFITANETRSYLRSQDEGVKVLVLTP